MVDETRQAMSIRLPRHQHTWLREQAFHERTSIQALIERGVDMLMTEAATAAR